MSLPGGNDPRTRARMTSLAEHLNALADSPRTDWDNLPMDTLIQIQADLLRALPRAVELVNVRIKQANSRAKVGLR